MRKKQEYYNFSVGKKGKKYKYILEVNKFYFNKDIKNYKKFIIDSLIKGLREAEKIKII